MEPKAADRVVQIVGHVSGELICSLRCYASTTVLQVKRAVMAAEGTRLGRQSLFTCAGDSPLEAETALGEVFLGEGHQVATLSLLRHTWKADKEGAWKREDAEANRQLLKAAENGSIDGVEEKLASLTCPDVVDQHGQTPLCCATRNGHLEVVQLLLEAGADKDKAMQDGATPLMFASMKGHLEVVRLLLEASADKDKANRNVNGATALMLTSMKGHHEVVRLLLEASADKDKANRNGATALMLASMKGHHEVVRLLLEASADKGNATLDVATALMLASDNGHLEVVQLLVEAGADHDKEGGMPPRKRRRRAMASQR